LKGFLLLIIIIAEAAFAKGQTMGWYELGAGTGALNANGPIWGLCADSRGNVYAGGYFTNSSGSQYVSIWNGKDWQQLGSDSSIFNAPGAIYQLGVDDSGSIYAAGLFGSVMKWNGTQWNQLGNGEGALNANGEVDALQISGNYIFVSGGFTDSQGYNYVAEYDPITDSWRELGTGDSALKANGEIYYLGVAGINEVYAWGLFTDATDSYYVAKWNGEVWSKFGTAANSASGAVCLSERQNCCKKGIQVVSFSSAAKPGVYM
jgi:hypothetical protein